MPIVPIVPASIHKVFVSYLVVEYCSEESKENEDDEKDKEKSSPHGEVILQN